MNNCAKNDNVCLSTYTIIVYTVKQVSGMWELTLTNRSLNHWYRLLCAFRKDSET